VIGTIDITIHSSSLLINRLIEYAIDPSINPSRYIDTS